MPDSPPPPGPADPNACPGPCDNPRPPGKYTCPSCWTGMTIVTRAFLLRQDDLAPRRHREMVDQFARGVPPGDIRVSRDATSTLGGPR